MKDKICISSSFHVAKLILTVARILKIRSIPSICYRLGSALLIAMVVSAGCSFGGGGSAGNGGDTGSENLTFEIAQGQGTLNASFIDQNAIITNVYNGTTRTVTVSLLDDNGASMQAAVGAGGNASAFNNMKVKGNWSILQVHPGQGETPSRVVLTVSWRR